MHVKVDEMLIVPLSCFSFLYYPYKCYIYQAYLVSHYLCYYYILPLFRLEY